jgi:hypothetical protein
MDNIQYFDQMKESRFLGWFDTTLEGEAVTIKSYAMVDIETRSGEPEVKWVVYFEEKEKGLVLNNTNRNMLAGLFNGEVSQSIGQKVTLYYRDDIEFQGRFTKGLRLKRYVAYVSSVSGVSGGSARSKVNPLPFVEDELAV